MVVSYTGERMIGKMAFSLFNGHQGREKRKFLKQFRSSQINKVEFTLKKTETYIYIYIYIYIYKGYKTLIYSY